jgi:putative membrane protein
MTPPPVNFDVQLTPSNHFAWIRTHLGLQRTLMAAVRTAVSLIGFGFTVAQFFQRLQEDAAAGFNFNPEAPRNLGMILIAAGVLSLLIFTWQYRSASNYLRGSPFTELATTQTPHRSVYLSAFAVMLIGVAAFISVLFRF